MTFDLLTQMINPPGLKFLSTLYGARIIVALSLCFSLKVGAQNYGNSQYPIWSELTRFEQKALAGVEKAKAGDSDALLRLYLLSAGDVRRETKFQQIKQKINHWIHQVENDINNEDSIWRRGYRLHREMHRGFFLDGNLGENAGKGYDFKQSQLSEVFRSKKFNCVSASLLFTVLAHKMDLSTRGVLLPSHVFIELELENQQYVEIETTTASGYDWVHDEAFYDQSESRNWFIERGLQPSTYADYESREIISPFEMGVQNMKNQHVRPERMSYIDRMRLIELVSELAPDDIKSHKIRIGFYSREYARLKELNDYKTLDKMYRTIAPFLDALALNPVLDDETKNLLAWVNSQRAITAIKNRRGEDGIALVRAQLAELDPMIDDFDKIKNNLYFALSRFVEDEIKNQNFTNARQVFNGSESQCLGETACISTLRHLYSRWAGYFWQSKNWPMVIDRYQEFLTIEPQGEAANLFQENIQSAYLNWSIHFLEQSDWLGASEILQQCIQHSRSSERCQARLAKLRATHRLD